jgi:two-component sensor histidine kinase
LQKEWDEYFDDKLFTDTSEVLIEKIQARFFSLELVGFKDCDLRFTAYGYASSIFTIILNELITNAFKYYSSENHLPVVLEWIETSEHRIIKCVTPSSKEERDVSKGSHKGHNFLNTLAEKLGGEFEIIPLEADEDLFCVEFKIPNDIFYK